MKTMVAMKISARYLFERALICRSILRELDRAWSGASNDLGVACGYGCYESYG